MKGQLGDWIRGLKVGDEVALDSRYGDGVSIETVTAVDARKSVTKRVVQVFSSTWFGVDGREEREEGVRAYTRRTIGPVTDEIRARSQERQNRFDIEVLTNKIQGALRNRAQSPEQVAAAAELIRRAWAVLEGK